jgi:hypothetical protein
MGPIGLKAAAVRERAFAEDVQVPRLVHNLGEEEQLAP